MQDGFVLRVSLPPSGDLAGLAPDMAVKLAEQLGLDGPGAERVGAAVAELARQVDASSGENVLLEFHKVRGELKIEARHGSRASETRVQLA